jgi:hypothetical protein
MTPAYASATLVRIDHRSTAIAFGPGHPGELAHAPSMTYFVEEAIDAEPRDPSDYENLLADLDDALEDLDAEFGERPFGENIIRICRDLGITPNWTDWAIEVWGIEAGAAEAGAAEAGAPEAGAAEEAGTGPSPFASDWPGPAQTGWSPESLSHPPPSTIASGSDPP